MPAAPVLAASCASVESKRTHDARSFLRWKRAMSKAIAKATAAATGTIGQKCIKLP